MRALRLGRRLSVVGFLAAAGLALVCLYIVILRVLAFIHIFGSHAGTALTQDEVLNAHNAATPDPRPQVIPKIIHQIFHNWRDPGNDTLPADWDTTRQTCIDRHKDWEYKLWNESASRAFLASTYSWFLPTYDSYAYPVQRVDTLRYFLMDHFGGIYLDLDNGCAADLTPLLYYPVFVTDGGQGALSNNILGARPQHPFWKAMTNALKRYNWNYGFPYVTISYASGQWFETAVWEEYHAQLAKNGKYKTESGTGSHGEEGGAAEEEPVGDEAAPLTRVMMDMRDGAARWVFFTMGRGDSWREWDYHVFGWIGRHVLLVVGSGVALFAATVWLLVRLCRCCLSTRSRKGYEELRSDSALELVRAEEAVGHGMDTPREYGGHDMQRDARHDEP